MSATFDVATWTEEVDNVTVTKKSFVKVDTLDDPKLMFHTPLERSYLCANIGSMVSWFAPFSIQWGSIRCKHVVRWLVENVFFQMKTIPAIAGTSAATDKLMEPH